ncbi:Fatty acid hydroxylase superfamily protein [Arenibacter nanhaiticus]|uniref:Fatty acid hydroxylase superfamily protein n=1 Tax=Arenibacter nanhaiticus TaxID=558155 RepID=A0A1M6DHE6_9FLAO|nr:sterol desaturase family protein [Arenibacter nanhaiticus]SHI72600.1 Fatty acid hydroxylase superfamily protein [Arenibacter nanhaiticus]
MDFTNPLVYGVPCFIAFILLELTYSKTHGDDQLYNWKDLAASGFMGIGSAIIAPLIKVVSAIVIFEYTYELFNPVTDGVRANVLGYSSFGYVWYVWIFCQLADDFTYYWFHRANHEIRILWAAHIVHHSSENFNLGTAIRNGWFTIFYKPLFYMWMPAIGFPPEMVVVCLGIEALWQFQLHSVYIPKLGFLEKIFNTHTMHQVHHAQNVEYLDKNHGGFLNIFDKMFGTWKEYDENIDVKYGVTHAPDTYNPVVILTHEFKDIYLDVKRSKKFSHALMYIFGPPGWSPDGSTLTVKQQQRLLKKESKSTAEVSFSQPN